MANQLDQDLYKQISCISLNHRVTPLATREKIAYSRIEAEEFMKKLLSELITHESVLLSTCNRTELYFIAHPEAPCNPVDYYLDHLKEDRNFEPKKAPQNYEVANGNSAITHLFRVVSGLESQILGESQILSQVKRAHEWGQSSSSAGRVLNRLLERSIRVGKRARTETTIGEGAVSASYAALELARKIYGSLSGRHVLIIGTGEIGLLALENLQGHDLGSLTILNRTPAKAEEMAQRFGGQQRDFSELLDALSQAEIVISSTSSPEAIVTFEQMKKIRQKRGGEKPLLIVDLALPRDFEEACGGLDLVFLKNLDDLLEVVSQNEHIRTREIPKVERIVEEECTSFVNWVHGLHIEPTILQLRDGFEQIRLEELAPYHSRCSAEQLALMDELTRKLVQRLLHLPTANLKRHKAMKDSEVQSLIHELLTEVVPHPKSDDKQDLDNLL